MSYVTNAILFIGALNENIDKKLEKVNEYFADDGVSPQQGFVDIEFEPGWYGGSKFLEAHLYVGAFNYLLTERFIEHLKSIEWESNVQLIIKDDPDIRFRIEEIFIHDF